MLRREPFTAAVQEDVRHFQCGEQPWAADLADWIGTDRVLDDLRDADLNCRVWIWRDEHDDVVGFGSLGDAVFRAAQGRAVGDDDLWLLVAFMVSPNSRLNDESPLAVLRRSRQEDVEAAVRAASAWGEHSAA